MKIVHAADLHLDSPLRGLARYEGAPVERLRGATRRAFERLIGLCLQEQAALLLIAGDVFDGEQRDYASGLYFVSQLARLREAGVEVVIVHGNHDAQTQVARELRYPENVRVLASRAPQSVRFDALNLVVHGQSYGKRDVREDLADKYPGTERGAFNIGLLHTALTGRPPHEPYAPTSLDVLRNKGYDYWALGHVHTREVVCEEPLVVFPGNLQGRHARELGPKGATLLVVENGRVLEVRAETLDDVRWAHCTVDASEASSGYDVVELARDALRQSVAAASGLLVAARLTLQGGSRAHAELVARRDHWETELRATALEIGGVWLEKIEQRTSERGARVQLGQEASSVLEQLETLLADPMLSVELVEELRGFRHKLPALLGEGEEALRLDDPAFVATLLPEARDLLLARLLPEEPA